MCVSVAGGEEWKNVAEKLGLTSTEICYLDKRTLNPRLVSGVILMWTICTMR